MNEIITKQVFFHVGLGKTGTTYLQYRVFPKLQDIKYIQRTFYREFKYVKLIENSSAQRFLVSNEFDKQLEREARKIASKFPRARIIVVLRQHDSWIASQYRRYIKNGFSEAFEKFIDIDKDEGYWAMKDLYYFPKLEMLEQLFGSKPLVLFHSELVKDPHSFIEKICAFTGATYDKESINLKRKHASYSEKQLKVRRQLNANTIKVQFPYSKTYWVKKIQRYGRMPRRYLSLYIAFLVPSKWMSDEPLIAKESMQRVRAHFEEDWLKCKAYSSDQGLQ